MQTVEPHTPNEAPAIDPDHHLWRNGRLWWIAFTIHRPNWTKHRVRLSLETDDLPEARRRRDRILDAFRERSDCRLSLRYPAGSRSARNGHDATHPVFR